MEVHRDTQMESPADVHKRMLSTAIEFLVDDMALAREICLTVAEEIRQAMMDEERRKIFESYAQNDADDSGIYESVM